MFVGNQAGELVGEVPWSQSRRVVDSRNLCSLYPQIVEYWSAVSDALPQPWRLPAVDEACVLDWLVFVAASGSIVDGRLGSRIHPVLRSLRLDAASVMCLAIELWVMVIYVPSLTGHERVATLLGPSGRQRTRMDDYTKAGALWRCRQAAGSTNTFLQAATGDGKLDGAICRATCNIFLRKVSSAFGGVRRLSWAWDPGSYSGHQYNVGMAHSLDIGKAAAIPVKVQCYSPE